MNKDSQIDNIDKAILKTLARDSRTPFVEIAESLGVVPGTIHLRVEKLKRLGILKRFTIELNAEALGCEVECLIGLKLHDAKQNKAVISKLKKYDEVLEIYYTTGTYNLFIKVITSSNRALYVFLSEKLQAIPEIHSTETVMILDVPLRREIHLGE